MAAEPGTRTRIAVIADDLTGAGDTAVQFAKQGLRTIVLLGSRLPSGRSEETVVVMDSRSRSLAPEEAYGRVAGIAAQLRDSGFGILFKKIDSTLRGNIGREIDAVMDACGLELAVVAPAFPNNGRSTVAGYLLLRGAPVEATEIARDPLCPVTESHIPTLLAGQTVRRVGHVGIKDVAAGAEGIRSALERLVAAGNRVILCDAWQDGHLRLAADAALFLHRPVLWVGSAGLAEHLPAALGLAATPPVPPPAARLPAAGRPVLVLAGSASDVTRGQVEMLARRPAVAWIEADSGELLRPEAAAREIGRCAEAALAAAAAGKDVVITAGQSGTGRELVRARALTANLSVPEAAERIATGLGGLCRRIAAGAALGGLVLTGGDTARSCLDFLSAAGFAVVAEVAPGIPLGRLQGGPCDGLRVVTKAGAFGAADALARAVDCLREPGREGARS
ncbi:MAG: four-carbon acid sugar kinase family protein [Syntrophales bacterium]